MFIRKYSKASSCHMKILVDPGNQVTRKTFELQTNLTNTIFIGDCQNLLFDLKYVNNLRSIEILIYFVLLNKIPSKHLTIFLIFTNIVTILTKRSNSSADAGESDILVGNIYWDKGDSYQLVISSNLEDSQQN